MVLRAGLHGTVGQSSAQVIDGSLKFSGDSHLTRTPSSGNQRTYTFSFWAKPCDISSNTNYFFTAGTSNPGGINNMALNFDSVNRLVFGGYKASDYDVENTAAYHRDTGWYHFVAAVDTTQSVPADRVKFYVNGIEQSKPTSGSPFGLDSTPFFNSNVLHTIGSSALSDYSGYMSQVYFIDGQALGPENFGYTDALTNTWRPKKFSGEYYLPQDGTIFSDFLSSTGGVEYAENAFDGSISSQEALGNTTNEPLVLDFSSLNLSGTLRVYVPAVSTGCTLRANVNGGSFVTASDNTAQWIDLGTVADIDEIRIQITNTNPLNFRVGLRAVEVNGSILVNGTPAQGTNSFYLPMDGNSPIGEDKSGRGNNWTPVNFGGSNTIEKATGALPILNTVSGGNVATAGVRTDSNSSSLVLALPLAGSANDVSNQINSGSTTKTITSTGTIASDTSIYNFYGLSSAFSINSYYSTNSSDFTFGTGDFTIECWVYNPSTYSGTLFSTNTSSSATTTLNSRFNGTTGTMDVYTSGLNEFTSITGVPLDEWVHLAFCRSSGSTLKVFVNGTLRATNTSWTESLTDSGNFYVNKGRDGNSTSTGSRKFQDVRVYKGVAKYTSNFIPASTNPDILPDTPSGVSGSSKLTKITDGAVAFDGTGDYLRIASTSDFDQNPGTDFTAECFFYMTALSGASHIFGFQIDANNRTSLYFSDGTNTLNWWTNLAGSNGNRVSASNVSTNAWHHVAITRSGSTTTMWLDGISQGTSTTTDYPNGNQLLDIGTYNASGYNPDSFPGFISNVRYIKGTALYTSNFTPPTAPLTNVTNTKLLCCQSNTSATAAAVAPTVSASDAELNIDLTSTPFSDVSGNGISVSNGNSVTAVTAPSNSYGLTYAAEFTAASEQRLVTGDVGQSTSNPFSIDGFFYVKPGSGGYLFDARSVTYTSSFYIYCIVSGSSVQFLTAQGSFTKPAGEWFHLRCTSTGIWYNGEYQAGASGFGNTQIAAITIGSRYTFSTFLDGYVGAFRFFRYEDIGAPSPEQYTLTSGVPSNSLTPLPILVVNAAATNFNPFTTDINAVRGQESGYATLNPLKKLSVITLSNGNLDLTFGSATNGHVSSTIGVSTGKWYWEYVETAGNSLIGISNNSLLDTQYPGQTSTTYSYFGRDSQKATNASFTSYGQSFTVGDTIGVALDMDAGTLTYYKNGVSLGVAFSGISNDTYFPAFSRGAGIPAGKVNFGQKPFKFPPPEGFQPLNSSTVRPSNVIARPDQYVGVTTYPGTALTQSIDHFNFKPDLAWIKVTDNQRSNFLFDSVRGAENYLISDSTGIQVNDSTYLTSFDLNGFTVGTSPDVNRDTSEIVAWTWKAGGSSNTFNIDDVGYANASDVNMSVGALNSSYYNQSQVWSNSGSGSFLSGYDATKAFDGSTATYAYATTGGASFTFSPAITGTTFEILVTSNSGSPYVTINGTNIPGSNGNVWVDVSLLANGSLSSIGIGGYPGSGSYAGFSQLKVDGKILVDQGVTPTQYPSIAATGCSVGTKQGFSIIQYQGNNLTGQTIKHGLTQKPDFILVKNKDEAYDWMIYHKSMGATYYGLFGTSAFLNNANIWADTEPTDEFFYVSVHNSPAGYSNGPNGEFISYLWHDVPGLQKFGSYQGNGSDDGTYVELGFRPALVIIKGQYSCDWIMADSEREKYNVMTKALFPNRNYYEAQASTNFKIDFLSNGFKLRNADGSAEGYNYVTNPTHIYAAWAEAPAFNLFGGQSNSR